MNAWKMNTLSHDSCSVPHLPTLCSALDHAMDEAFDFSFDISIHERRMNMGRAKQNREKNSYSMRRVLEEKRKPQRI